MAEILLIHGPNLNLLGTREPGHYGNQTLSDIDKGMIQLAKKNNRTLEAVQSNSESTLIDHIHHARTAGTRFIIINPAAYTHTSVALRDALLSVEIPFIEVHLSNTHAREKFRHHSYFSDIAIGVIIGLGAKGYELALQSAIEQLNH